MATQQKTQSLGEAILQQLIDQIQQPVRKASELFLNANVKAASAPMDALMGATADASKLFQQLTQPVNDPEQVNKGIEALQHLIGQTAAKGVPSAVGSVAGALKPAQKTQTPQVPSDLSFENPMLDPYFRGANKAIEKAQEESGAIHANEAIQQLGIAGAQQGIAAHAQQVQQQKQQGILQQLLGGLMQNSSMNTDTGEYKPATALFGLLQEHPETTFQNVTSMEKMQEMQGKKPLGLGEREKIKLEGMNQFFDKVLTSHTSTGQQSAENIKLLSNVDSGLEQVTNLENVLNTRPNAFKDLVTPGNTLAQVIKTSRADLVDILGRLRSGGAINKDEEAAFTKQIPNQGFFEARMESLPTAKFKLAKLRKLFTDIRQAAKPADKGFSNRIVQALQAGATREQIYRLYGGSLGSEATDHANAQ